MENHKKIFELSKNFNHSLNMANGEELTHCFCLFIADIIAVLYENILKFDPRKPNMKNRDRFILSKGHAGAGVYVVLAEKNFFSVNELLNHYQNGSNFQDIFS